MDAPITQQLRCALERRELKVHYQPKFHLSTGELQGVEALLRWRTGSGSWIEPSAFVPILEQTGMINAVGAWLFECVATDSAYWQSHGQPQVRVAINVSPLQLHERDFLKWVLSICTAWQSLGMGLDLELTESALLPDSHHIVGALNALSAANVRIALDDFGTGYSSLSLLTRLPVRHLKIDRAFVAQLGVCRKCEAIIAAIIRLGRDIGLETIAEGIETEQQLQRLQGMGCDIGQGYLFSPARSREDLLSWLCSRDANDWMPKPVDGRSQSPLSPTVRRAEIHF